MMSLIKWEKDMTMSELILFKNNYNIKNLWILTANKDLLIMKTFVREAGFIIVKNTTQLC